MICFSKLEFIVMILSTMCCIFLLDNGNANVIAIGCVIAATMVTVMLIILISYVCRRRRRYEHLRQVQ